MESEKVKEIKKALECCANWNGQSSCNDCPIGIEKCYEDENLMPKLALTLINELESENERLLEQRNKTYNIWVKDTEKLKDRIAELEKKNEKLKQTNKNILMACNDFKNEHLKQFAEKVLKFVKEYAFKDSKEIYTNGAILVPLFRVEYALKTGGQDYQQG